MPNIPALTVADVARRLAIDTTTVHRRARTGRLPYVVKEPGRTGAYLFAPAAIEKAAAAAGVVSVIDLARELHPGDPDGHGVETIGREIFGREVEPDTGVVALWARQIRRSPACTDPECVAAAGENVAEDRLAGPYPPAPDGWVEL